MVRSLTLHPPSTPRSLDALLGKHSLITLNWLQRVQMGAGVAAGVECAQPSRFRVWALPS